MSFCRQATAASEFTLVVLSGDMKSNAERHWRELGDDDPFFGVLSDPKFLKANLSDESREEFFQSGEQDVQGVYSVIQAKIRQGFHAQRVLDFGCGVGRLLIPFAKRAHTVVGIDVSPGMLAEAERNLGERGLRNVRLLRSQVIDTLDPGTFDLVHSFIVFQHIPVSDGEILFRKLIRLIAPGGVGAIHLTFSDNRSAVRRAVSALRARSNLAHRLVNVAQGKPFSEPLMQMNRYSMNRIVDMLIDTHCSSVHMDFTEHFGTRGAMIYFEKT